MQQLKKHSGIPSQKTSAANRSGRDAIQTENPIQRMVQQSLPKGKGNTLTILPLPTAHTFCLPVTETDLRYSHNHKKNHTAACIGTRRN